MDEVSYESIDAALQEVLKSTNPLDAPDFDAIEYINQTFPNEQSLCNIGNYIDDLQNEMTKLNDEIITCVREQASYGAQSMGDLEEVKSAIRELSSRIVSMRIKAEESESLVHEVCKDIKSLDVSKTNLLSTINTLKKLVDTVICLDHLREFAAERRYKEAANEILALQHFCVHFHELRQLPKIADLLRQKDNIFTELKKQLMEDFDTIFDPDQETIPNLAEACLAANSMGSDVRRDIITQFCLQTLEPYKKIFQPPQKASELAMTERRFHWMLRMLREFESTHAIIFPASWNVSCYLCEHFCHVTRQHLVEVLGRTHHSVEPSLLFDVLHKAKTFEESLVQRFQASNLRIMAAQLSENSSEPHLSSHLKYPEALDPVNNNISCPTADVNKISEEDHVPRFRDIISECFEAYLGSWVQKEERRLQDAMTEASNNDPIIGEADVGDTLDDPTENESDMPRFAYSSASELFSLFKACLKQTLKVSTHKTLFDIFQAFKRVFRKYSDVLSSRLAPMKKNNTSTSDNFNNIILNPEDVKRVCCVIGSAEYCDVTLDDLAEAVKRVIDEQKVPLISFDAEKDVMWDLKAKGVGALRSNVEEQIEKAYKEMADVNWVTLNEVVEQSRWVATMYDIILSQLTLYSSFLSVPYFKFFCDKFVQSFIPNFISRIYGLKNIGELGAQQLLLDVYSLKTYLLEIPVLAARGRPTTAAYSKYVIKDMNRAEVILKILTSSTTDSGALEDMLKEYTGCAAAEDVAKILSLKAWTRDGASRSPSQGVTKRINTTSSLYELPRLLSAKGTSKTKLINAKMWFT